MIDRAGKPRGRGRSDAAVQPQAGFSWFSGSSLRKVSRDLARLSARSVNARHPDVLAAQRKERARIRGGKGIRWRGRPIPDAA